MFINLMTKPCLGSETCLIFVITGFPLQEPFSVTQGAKSSNQIRSTPQNTGYSPLLVVRLAELNIYDWLVLAVALHVFIFNSSSNLTFCSPTFEQHGEQKTMR